MKKQSPHVRSFQQHLLFQLLGVAHGGHQMIHHAIHADLAKREPERTGCRRVFPKKDRSPVEYLYLCMGIYIYVYLSMYLLIYIFIYVLMYYLSIITYLLIYLFMCVIYYIK